VAYRRSMVASAREWLIGGAPGASNSQEVLAGTCERLVAAGVPLCRGEAYVRTLHPQVAGRAFAWVGGEMQVIEAQHEAEMGVASSPVRSVLKTAAPVRWAAAQHAGELGAEVEALGVTDVAAFPLVFTSGEVHACAFLTARGGGFTDAQVAAIADVIAPLSRMGEILALRRTATNVLTAYVGRDAGARVLAGKIRRGDTEVIDAAIWFSDMRGFSTVSGTMRPTEVIGMLNELFDFQLPAIERHGGEVLKFMGDGLLAIFTAGPGEDRRACCERALRASREAVASAAAVYGAGTVKLDSDVAIRIAAEGLRPPIHFGIALHVGEVAYGNIGGQTRLDFTCIGRSVNLAARLESLTGKTGRDILASEEFVAHAGGAAAFESIGEFEVKGFAERVRAFAPSGG
jgi:adenylate cyclase